MPVNVTVEFEKDLEPLRQAFASFPDTVAPFLRRASQAAAFTVERESKKKSPIDTGRLRSSIATSLGILNRGITSIVQTNVNYAAAVHEGTRPHFPPYKQLEGWAKRRGMNAFLVARGISRKGTKAQPFMRDAVMEKKDTINNIYGDEIENAMKAIANKVS